MALKLNSSTLKTAQAVVAVLPQSRWQGVGLAKGLLAYQKSGDIESAASVMRGNDPKKSLTVQTCKDGIQAALRDGFGAGVPMREKTGSAENPITKLIPATVTEQRFFQRLRRLVNRRKTVQIQDDRKLGHKYSDFTLIEGTDRLPINVKNAGTRFEKALELVGLDPDDCLPIPAYKAHGAIDSGCADLVYAICQDYELVGDLQVALDSAMTQEEKVVWALLNEHQGKLIKDAEDQFIQSIVSRYWGHIQPLVKDNPFRIVSAKRAISILHEQPKRTPGIGQKGWGTGASAEVNVHISVSRETVDWEDISDIIKTRGLKPILSRINKTVTAEVPKPTI